MMDLVRVRSAEPRPSDQRPTTVGAALLHSAHDVRREPRTTLQAILGRLDETRPISRNLVEDLLAAMEASPGGILDLGDAVTVIVGAVHALRAPNRCDGTAP